MNVYRQSTYILLLIEIWFVIHLQPECQRCCGEEEEKEEEKFVFQIIALNS